jgi:hypothetical protein
MADAIAVFDPGWRAEDDDGAVISEGVLKFFDAGTTSPKIVYSDKDLVVPLGTEVDLNSGGYPVSSGNNKTLIYVGSDAYKVRLEDADDVTVWEHDNIKGALVIATLVTATPKRSVVNTANDTTILASEAGTIFNIDCSSGDRSVTLPNATQVEVGVPFGICHAGSANSIVISTVISQTIAIPGSLESEITLAGNGEMIDIYSDGSNWRLTGKIEAEAAEIIINETTVSVAVASITVDIPSGTKNFRVTGTGFSCSTSGNLSFRLSDTGGSTSEIITGRATRDNNATMAGSDVATTQPQLIIGATASIDDGNFVIEVFNADVVSGKKVVRSQGASAGDNQGNTVLGETPVCAAINFIEILFTAGNIDAGSLIVSRF